MYKFYLEEIDSFIYLGRTSHITKRLIVNGHYEPEIFELLSTNLPNKGDFIDVGANAGVFSIFLAKNVESTRKVLSVEPHPDMQKLLIKNMNNNNLTDSYILFAGGVSDRPGNFNLNYIEGKEEYSSLTELRHEAIKSEVNSAMKVKVDVQTIDNLCIKYKLEPSFIKIDVEGLECKVLMGSKKAIEKYKPLLIIEVSDHLNENSSSEILNYLDSIGYSIYDAEKYKRVLEFKKINTNILAIYE